MHTNHGYAHVRCQVVTGYGRSSNRIASSALSTSGSLPVITKALLRRKVTPQKALLHQHKAPKPVKELFDKIEARPERYELNLYITGYDEDLEEKPTA